MNAAEDDLTRDQALALCVFLESEKHRHEDDILFIEQTKAKVKEKFNVTDDEWKDVYNRAKRYVKF